MIPLYGNYVPIGLYKNKLGQWRWSDGSPFDYSHFQDCDPRTTSYASLGTSWDLSFFPSLYWACNDETDTFSTVICQKEVL